MDKDKKKPLTYRIGHLYVKISLLFTTVVALAAAVRVLKFVSQFVFSFLSFIFKVN